jgi:hypothetical protein
MAVASGWDGAPTVADVAVAVAVELSSLGSGGCSFTPAEGRCRCQRGRDYFTLLYVIAFCLKDISKWQGFRAASQSFA